jgi:hypothetical protein
MSTKHYTAEAFREIALEALETLLEASEVTDICRLTAWTDKLEREIKDASKGIMSEELGERDHEDRATHYQDVDGEDLESGVEFE